CADFGNLQADIDKWANESLRVLPCKRALKPCPINETTQQRVFVHGEPCILLVSVINPGNLTNRHPTALPHLVTILGGK
ncbi:unnamed protein product, partial [Gadus morhua 'NCC']